MRILLHEDPARHLVGDHKMLFIFSENYVCLSIRFGVGVEMLGSWQVCACIVHEYS